MTALRLALALVAVTAALAGCGDGGGGGGGGGGDEPPPPKEPEDLINHFLCYPVETEGFQPPGGIRLVDQFFPGAPVGVGVARRESLCNPVQKNERGTPPQADAHLLCYVLQGRRPPDRPLVRISNQFDRRQGGPQSYRVGQVLKLCLPTGKTKDVDAPDPPPIPTTSDHYKCYQLHLVGTFKPFNVRLSDQLVKTTAQVNQAVLLCNPTEKFIDGEPESGPMKHPAAHLVCYPVESTASSDLPVRIANQFEPDATITPIRPTLLCVPSTKQIVAE